MMKLRTADGVDVRARVLRLTSSSAVVEISDRPVPLTTSEVLDRCSILIAGQRRYQGGGAIRSCVETGTVTVCDVALDESAWEPAGPASSGLPEFDDFLEGYHEACTLRADYRLVVSEMLSFFTMLKTWLDSVQANLVSLTAEARAKREEEIVAGLQGRVLPCIDALFEKFEAVADSLPADAHPAHRIHMRQMLHPLVLCAPFAHRTFHKPLGYAGDYEMVNMLAKPDFQGDSLYAKMVNAWFLRQAPALAHRNRIRHLVRVLHEAAAAAAGRPEPIEVLSVGCGPAIEVQDFVRELATPVRVNFTLLDFNQQTLDHARTAIERARGAHARKVRIRCTRRSVTQLLKEASVRKRSPQSDLPLHDLVYCTGLFDYLTSAACRQLCDALHTMVAPGGRLLVTNVNRTNPLRHGMDHLLDWSLIYRTTTEMRQLRPGEADPEAAHVYVEPTGVNVFLEVRKPANV